MFNIQTFSDLISSVKSVGSPLAFSLPIPDSTEPAPPEILFVSIRVHLWLPYRLWLRPCRAVSMSLHPLLPPPFPPSRICLPAGALAKVGVFA